MMSEWRAAERLVRPVARRSGGWHRRFRARLRVRAVLVRVAILALAALALIGPARSLASGEPERFDTSTVSVPLATRELLAGEIIDADDVRMLRVDEALAPPGAVRQPVGATIASRILEGEVIDERRLGSIGRLGLAADERAVAIARPLAPLPLETGDVVELVVLVAGVPGGAGQLTSRQIGSGRVVALDGSSVVVAVPTDLVGPLLEYQATGSVELALTPWRS